MAVIVTYSLGFRETFDLLSGVNSIPSLVSLIGGGYALGYSVGGGATSLGIFDANAEPGAGVPVITPPDVAGYNLVTAQLTGGAYVSVFQTPAFNSTISFEVRSIASGTNPVADTDLGDANSRQQEISALSGGGFVIVAQDQIGGDDNDIDVYVRNSTGGAVTSFTVDSATANYENPSVAGISDGGFAVSWTRVTNSVPIPQSDLMYATYNADGSVRQAPILIDGSGSTNSHVQVLALANGGSALIYEDSGWETGKTNISIVLFAQNGAVEDVYRVTTGNLDASPSATQLSNGMIAVSFTDVSQSGKAFLQIFDPLSATNVLTSPLLTSSTDTGAYATALASGTAGEFAMTYFMTNASQLAGSIMALERTTTGDTLDNVMVGDNMHDTIIGNGGNDTLNGQGGNDDLRGGAGNDTYYVDSTGDTITETVGDGFDTVRSSVSTGLGGGREVERLATTSVAGTGSINLTGNEFAQEIYGNNGSNVLNGGVDALRDILTGYAGNDAYYIQSSNDIIVEAAGGGTSDSVYASLSFTLAADDSIETVQTTNSNLTTAINLTGNGLAQSISGNAGVNVLNGGMDNLADTLTGYGGNDIYIIQSGLDLIVEVSGGGADDRAQATVSFALAADDNIEVLQTTNAGYLTDINLTGNVGGQSIYGNAGVNTLNGGIDSARDTLIGYGGNDTYVINSTTDLIVEALNGGTADRAQTSVMFALAADDDIEIFETTNAAGITALNLTGNAVIQSVTGNAGANTLNGGLGNDTLTGLGGSDNFLFNTALSATTNHDTITDFNVAADTIQLENAIFALLAATGALATNLFEDTSIAGQGGTEVVIYDRANGDLYYDTNGAGTAGGLVLFADVANNTVLTSADFSVV